MTEPNENMKNIMENCFSTITKLFDKYKEDAYMLQRLNNHINLYLSNTLENECKNHEKRQNMNAHLNEEQIIFTQIFLSNHNYYYLSNNNLFYEYNGLDYYIVKEDDIVHKLLSSISKDRTLLQWKYKTKISVIKQIKERILFSCIPETDTIQNILNNLYPSIFSSKNYAKYFLTIIGDNILKKNNDNPFIFICSPKMKQLLDELEKVSILCIGISNISNKFITKYHDNHGFQNSRLISINENVSNEYWRELLKKIGLNLLCVAVHYSTRFQSSEGLLELIGDDEIVPYIHSLKNTTQQGLIQQFIEQYIQPTTNDLKIEWKNIHFIWKQFLSNNKLPNVIYSNTLKGMLKDVLSFDEETDSFVGITSKYIPLYKDFIQFWNDTIHYCDDHNQFEHDLEIDEINTLFKLWSKSQNNTIKHLTEENIIKILQHFFSLEIVNNKFILNVVSLHWNKSADIDKSFQYIQSKILEAQQNTSLIGFDELYNYYNKYCAENSIKMVVCKRYFEKYILYKYSEYIMYDKFVSISVFTHSNA